MKDVEYTIDCPAIPITHVFVELQHEDQRQIRQIRYVKCAINKNKGIALHHICRCDVCDGSQDDGRRKVSEQSVQRITSKETAQT